MPTREGRIAELDALRGFAALAVVLYHFTTRFETLFGHAGALAATFPWGEYGVDFFLMLSGFVILRSLDRTPRASDFVVGRFARLYPAYWAAGAITFGVVCWFGLPGQEIGLGEAALNVTMLQRQLGARHLDGAYWSLEVELFFYALALALHRAGAFRTARRQYLTLSLWLLAEAVSIWAVSHGGAGMDRSWTIRFVGKLQVLFSLRFAHLFTVGIVLYQAGRSRRMCAAAGVLLSACSAIQAIVDSWGAAVGMAGLAGLLYLAVNGRLTWLAARPLVFLGGISYPLYLVHQNVGYVIIRELESRGVGPMAAISLALATSLAAAVALSLGVERPAQRLMVKRGSKREAASSRLDDLSPITEGAVLQA
ncbi:MAG TPA: acyltransferase [Pirellulales bacterium]|nr:acyltransferase [Pirellulales bacterium]